MCNILQLKSTKFYTQIVQNFVIFILISANPCSMLCVGDNLAQQFLVWTDRMTILWQSQNSCFVNIHHCFALKISQITCCQFEYRVKTGTLKCFVVNLMPFQEQSPLLCAMWIFFLSKEIWHWHLIFFSEWFSLSTSSYH